MNVSKSDKVRFENIALCYFFLLVAGLLCNVLLKSCNVFLDRILDETLHYNHKKSFIDSNSDLKVIKLSYLFSLNAIQENL